MTSGQPPSLSGRQIEQIIRYKAGGMPYKEVARLVGCTPDQAIHYWRTSTRYKAKVMTKPASVSATRREARKAREKAQAARDAARAAREQERRQQSLAAAAEALRAEVALAVREAPTAPAYKLFDLEW